ncbi:2'-5' RNA ligase family protein [Nocardia puris]|uniref:2'-5' RNA ligase superfamily protein n=1 Tax=Nocardia puris TaxID=208602 RepID=A0A366DMM9_9NOCA|nr:2'-5' RNA ligase family protein [Nocardia puris]RBO91357.1 hypothetical protein DFR74_10459 [Nocardia puris]
MRNIAHAEPTPPGPRPHVWITSPFGPVVTDRVLGKGVLPGDQIPCSLDDWHPTWRAFVRPLITTDHHLTLAWLDVPSSELAVTMGGSACRRIASSLWTRLEDFPPVTLTLTGLVVSDHDIRLTVRRTPELDQLADVAVATLHDRFGPDAPVRGGPASDWSPHITVAHGFDDVETTSGPLALPSNCEDRSTKVVFVRVGDHDPWADDAVSRLLWNEHDVPVDQSRYRARNGGRLPAAPWQ